VAGVFSVAFSVWYLFFAKGGNLFLYPSEVMRFFQADDSVDQALALAQPPPAAKCLEGEHHRVSRERYFWKSIVL
ncbi:hypothetical protein CQA86_32195, partial [Klebsiella pneumoniae]